MAAAERKSDFERTTETPYLAREGGVSIVMKLQKIYCVITARHYTYNRHP